MKWGFLVLSLVVTILLLHGCESTFDTEQNDEIPSHSLLKMQEHKFIFDSNNSYREKFKTIRKDNNFFESISKINDTVVNKASKHEKISKKRLEEMKDAMHELFDQMQTESQQMKYIFDQVKNHSSIENISLDKLKDLVEILHSNDAAVDLHYYKGYEYFMDLIEKMKTNFKERNVFNQTIFNTIMHVFTYSAQNNEPVKQIFMDLHYDSFLLQLIDFMFENQIDKSCLSHIIISMNTYLKFCPKCLGNFLSDPHYNHTIQKLLTFSPETYIFNSIVSLLNYAIEEKEIVFNVNDYDPMHIYHVEQMIPALDKVIVDDHICQIFTNLAHQTVENLKENGMDDSNMLTFFYTHQELTPSSHHIKLILHLKNSCPDMVYDSEIEFLLRIPIS